MVLILLLICLPLRTLSSWSRGSLSLLFTPIPPKPRTRTPWLPAWPGRAGAGCPHGLVGAAAGEGQVPLMARSPSSLSDFILDTSTQIPPVPSQKKVVFFQSLHQDAEDLSPWASPQGTHQPTMVQPAQREKEEPSASALCVEKEEPSAPAEREGRRRGPLSMSSLSWCQWHFLQPAWDF